MPPGSTLKQLATAAAKANLNKKPSGRTMAQTNVQSTIVKPNIQISLHQQSNYPSVMPRSGGQVPSLKNDFTPTSLNAAISAGLLMGNS